MLVGVTVAVVAAAAAAAATADRKCEVGKVTTDGGYGYATCMHRIWRIT